MITSLRSFNTQDRGRARAKALIRPLQEVLAYSNDAVIERYQKDLGISCDDAALLFSDVKRFLWLAAVEGVIAPPPKIDDGWHTFIIFTLDYKTFCERYFGRFMHHRPTRSTDAPDDGNAVRSTVETVKMHFGSYKALSDNWRFPWMNDGSSCWGGSCSSDSVSCAPTPSCSSVRIRHS
jgi:hypothetical protein